MNFEQLCKTVKENTEINYHSENLILIATHYGFNDLLAVFQAVHVICHYEKCTPFDLKDYRYRKYEQLMQRIKEQHPEQYDTIYSCL